MVGDHEQLVDHRRRTPEADPAIGVQPGRHRRDRVDQVGAAAHREMRDEDVQDGDQAESGAKARSGSQPDVKKPASEVVLEVSVSKAGDSASYAVSYTREGVLAAKQKGSLTLR